MAEQAWRETERELPGPATIETTLMNVRAQARRRGSMNKARTSVLSRAPHSRLLESRRGMNAVGGARQQSSTSASG